MFRVAIVGRPNVGKSTLFNRLCGRRKAIVGDEPGITRDRIHQTVAWQDRRFELVDTGGMIPQLTEGISAKVREQVEQAVAESDLLLLVVDGRAGITPLDEHLLPVLRKSGKILWVVVNKVDTPATEPLAAPFYAFGAQEVFPLSAEHNRGVQSLMDAITLQAGDAASAPAEAHAEEIAVAVVGRPNVGKSSLVNRLLGMERTIVSEIPGTTRDAVDTRLVREGICYRIIDTAGIRRKGRTEERTEKVSVIMARKNLDRADVALLLLDAEEGVTKLDATIGGYASESGCSIILVLNKWDKIAKDPHTLPRHTEMIRRRMKYLAYAPVLAVSALNGQGVPKLFGMIRQAWQARRFRVATGTLNHLCAPELAAQWTHANPAHRWDIRYMTQASGVPPTFVVFTAGSRPLHFSTERFLANQLREKYGFYATPIRIRQRVKGERRGRS
jgi:GTP-binding protein